MRRIFLISYILSLSGLVHGFANSNFDCCDLTEPYNFIHLNDYPSDVKGVGVLLQKANFWLGLPENNNAMAILKIAKGTKVKILNLEAEYYKINHKDLIGYIEKKLVKLIENEPGAKVAKVEEKIVAEKVSPKSYSSSKPIKASFSGAYTVTKATSLRKGADYKSSVLLRLPAGGRVEVLESPKGYWWKVKYEGTSGWAKCALLKQGD